MTRTVEVEQRRQPAAGLRRKGSSDTPRRRSYVRRPSVQSRRNPDGDTDSLTASSPVSANKPFGTRDFANQRSEKEAGVPNVPLEVTEESPSDTRHLCSGVADDPSGASELSMEQENRSSTKSCPSTTSLVRRSRRGRPRGTHKERFIVVCNGRYEIPRHPDLKQLRRFRPEPGAGWCKKYWWDYSAQLNFERDDETGGVILAYSENHQQALRRIHVALAMALKDETAPLTIHTPNQAATTSKQQTMNEEREVEGAIPRRFQTLQDHLRFPVEPVFTERVEGGENNTSRGVLRGWEQRRLVLDLALSEEHARQQRIRKRQLQ